ncbi:MAG: hypothetical protein KF796_18985 [Ramlibacter sp.]|nr:hypothetical protein [Ramlibacter sp.]
MSYLNSMRLHFAGQFQANVSTVNNDPGHFDNASFKPDYQKMEGNHMLPPNGWFNPQGDAAWRFLGCQVTSAWLPSGAVSGSDPVLQCIVADSDGQVPAKLVDLDSEQQLVSEIWGLQVRIADASGNTLLRSDFEPAAFADIWDRATGSGAGGDIGAGAMYQSVLTRLEWGDVSASPFLVALKAAAATGRLSIKFNVDGLNMDFTSPDFMCGRIVGTIGPATETEPRHLLMGRQFMASAAAGGNFFTPVGGINFCAGVVDSTAGCIYLDLGNALTTSSPGGQLNDLGPLTLGVYDPIALPGSPAGSVVPLGTIPSQGSGGYASDAQWYSRTAGIVALPLKPAQLQAVGGSPLVLTGNASVAISEWDSGTFVRADTFVYRLSPGDTVAIPVVAMQWGEPLAGAAVSFSADPSQLQPGSGFPYVCPSPPVATPADALSFNTTALTDATGRATLVLDASDPGTPRWFNNGQDYGIDGQVYGIRPALADPQYSGPVNQWNFISVLLWSGFTPANPVTWNDLQPIFQQYANLYPVMNRFLNLGDYTSVVSHAGLLLLAFGLDPANPNAMPVTRDLSPAKRKAILSWLKNPLPGTPPAPRAAAAGPAPVATAPMATAGDTTPAAGAAFKGGKASAAARRLILQ